MLLTKQAPTTKAINKTATIFWFLRCTIKIFSRAKRFGLSERRDNRYHNGKLQDNEYAESSNGTSNWEDCNVDNVKNQVENDWKKKTALCLVEDPCDEECCWNNE